MEDCFPWEGYTLEQGKSVRSFPPEQEGAAETMCDGLTLAHSQSCSSAGAGEREFGSEVEPGKKVGVR